ncbi:hypothetical protein RIF29_09551 [Crotalaria pallida]|uniref:Uncharacterized protein n=1 Tax=Crotalaria pallida TaxID=3830 RepID=A0AAN9IJI1_CROPI
MGSNSSDEDSEISESEIDDYKEKFYNEIKVGKYKVQNPNATTVRCPWCEGKKKQSYKFKDLLQHATGIGSSSSRGINIKAKHQALAKYLKQDINNEADTMPDLEEIADEQPDLEERFVWPWKGIVANVFRNHEPEDYDNEQWQRKFQKYEPKASHVMHSDEFSGGYVVLDFGTDWTGFRQVMKLETDFLTANHGKKDWDSREMMSPSTDFYAWCARAEDYGSEGQVGTYLREKAALKTTSEVNEETWKERSQTLVNLVGEIDHANRAIGEVETRFTQTSMSLNEMMEERDLLHKNHVRAMERMQQVAREHALRTIEETEKLKRDIHTRSVELDRWCQQLSEQEASTAHERRKLEEEKKKKMESLILASEEQVKASNDFAKLLEVHKTEKKVHMDTILKMKKELEKEHTLKLEIAELEGKLKVFKCMNVMGDDPEQGRKKEIEEIEEKLFEMIEEMNYKNDENQALMIKEQQAKRELEDAQKEIIAELPKYLKGSTNIGVKKLGEISAKPFQKVCKDRYATQKLALSESANLHSKWQNEILDSTWQPFKIVEVEKEGKEVVIDEDDQKLSTLKTELGEEVYEAVVTALKEMVTALLDMNEYSSSGRRYVVPEIWNFKVGRRATLKEVIAYIIGRIKQIK